jgi:tryptophan-rich sensory protein
MVAMQPVVTAVIVCVVAATLEGLCAGREVKPFFATLKFPRYSAPLWLWTIIGGLYYLLFGFLVYRLFLQTHKTALWWGTVLLILGVMVLNALSNYVIFRQKDLSRSFLIGAAFPVLDGALFVCLIRIDLYAATWMIPYLIYRVYAVWWGYGLMRLNRA